MFIRVHADLRVTLENPHNFKQFHVEITKGLDPTAVGKALGATARLDSGKIAWVSESALRAWPSVRGDKAWQESFSAMLAYARQKGWIDTKTGAIQAHIEWK